MLLDDAHNNASCEGESARYAGEPEAPQQEVEAVLEHEARVSERVSEAVCPGGPAVATTSGGPDYYDDGEPIDYGAWEPSQCI